MKTLGKKISCIVSINSDEHAITLQFGKIEKITISLKPLFDKPKGLVAEILKGNFFDQCFVEHGALAWPNGLELCPDALYSWHLNSKKHPSKKAA